MARNGLERRVTVCQGKVWLAQKIRSPRDHSGGFVLYPVSMGLIHFSVTKLGLKPLKRPRIAGFHFLYWEVSEARGARVSGGGSEGRLH